MISLCSLNNGKFLCKSALGKHFFAVFRVFELRIVTKHLMTSSVGNSEFRFPSTSTFVLASPFMYFPFLLSF